MDEALELSGASLCSMGNRVNSWTSYLRRACFKLSSAAVAGVAECSGEREMEHMRCLECSTRWQSIRAPDRRNLPDGLESAPRRRCRIELNGTERNGWQRQQAPSGSSRRVEGTERSGAERNEKRHRGQERGARREQQIEVEVEVRGIRHRHRHRHRHKVINIPGGTN